MKSWADTDPEKNEAYYSFDNLVWPTSNNADLPSRERVLIAEFIHKEINSRPKPNKEGM